MKILKVDLFLVKNQTSPLVGEVVPEGAGEGYDNFDQAKLGQLNGLDDYKPQN